MDINLIKDFGFPVFLVLLLLGTLGLTGKWLASNVVTPMVKSHIDLVENLQKSNTKTSEFVAMTAETLKKLETKTSENHSEIKEILNEGGCNYPSDTT